MRVALTVFFLFSLPKIIYSQTILAVGEQPQIAIDLKGTIRVVYGTSDKIFYSDSKDNGSSFTKPTLIAEVPGMHLGMTRGPQIACSKDYSVVTAMDKQGNIHSFMLDHKTGKWEKTGRVNDKEGSAPEGLMSITADDNNHFYAAWLDLRINRKNNISFASFEKKKWSANKFAYVSAEDHVCECCKPSITAKGKMVSIMFRNWLKGSRDLYLTTSTDGGKTFPEAQKLGNGTWPLKGCPMDGGGLSINSENQIHTAWQRTGVVYYTRPGQPEERIADGRHVSVNGNIITWEAGSDLMVKRINQPAQKLGTGTALQAILLNDSSILGVWEKDGQIVFTKIKS
jgi:hypothetical protein